MDEIVYKVELLKEQTTSFYNDITYQVGHCFYIRAGNKRAFPTSGLAKFVIVEGHGYYHGVAEGEYKKTPGKMVWQPENKPKKAWQMKDDMIDSKDKGMRFDLSEYSKSKKVMKDYPELMTLLGTLISVLYKKREYTGIEELLQSAEETRLLLAMQYDYYKYIYKNKGKINEPKNIRR